MEKSEVYFTTFKTTGNENLLQKLKRLIKTAGMNRIDFTDKYTAIKIHFGELGNLAFLRPNYAKVVADYVKELGGKPNVNAHLCVGCRRCLAVCEDTHDHFHVTHPDTEWESCLQHAQDIGIGSRQYELKQI